MAPPDDLAAHIADVEKRLGHVFRNRGIAEEAVTHASRRSDGASASNTRLAWLGDAIVDLAASRLLFERRAELDAGELTDARKDVVSDDRLAQIAHENGLDAALLIGRSRGKEGPTTAMKAGILEALLGAVLLDACFDQACAVAERLLGPYVLTDSQRRDSAHGRLRVPP